MEPFQKFPGALLGDGKLAIAGKETDEDDEENPIKYLATNKIDVPTEYVIRSYAMHWHIETFFEDSKQNLDLGDCEMQTDEGVPVGTGTSDDCLQSRSS